MERALTGDEVRRWRSRFPILERCTYLINNSLGAMPGEVEEETARYTRTWGQRGVRAWHEGWWEMAVSTGDLLAPILGVGRGEIALQPNVSLAASLFLSCFDFPATRNRIVVSALDFPSLIYVAATQRRRGAELKTLGSPADREVPIDALLATIDERTRLVMISHASFKSASLLDAAAVARRCRETGALLLLDVYQTAGAMPLSLADWGVDAAVGGTLKWLCGGPGVAFLWVEPGLARTLEPAITGWQADREPFAFRPGPIRYAEGAWRFLTGTPNVPGLYACRPGARIIAEVGTERIRERSLRLTGSLIRGAEAAHLELRSPTAPAARGGTVTIWHPEAERLSRGLIEQGVYCDFRPDAGIRLSPHFYNTLDECDRAVAALASLARG